MELRIKSALACLVVLSACNGGNHLSLAPEPVHSSSNHGASGEVEPSSQLPDLRVELLAMLELDQRVREEDHGLVMGNGHGETDHSDHSDSAPHDHEHTSDHQQGASASAIHGQAMHTVDARNTARMKEVVSAHGWPGRRLVGKDGAQAAFLLVQHADADPAFQESCLELMKEAPTGEVSTVDVAYLTDRVRVNTGRSQLYGTQFWMQGGKLVPRPIEDEERLAERRKAVGLIPMDEYREHMEAHDQGGQH